jgi:hypothetical protein
MKRITRKLLLIVAYLTSLYSYTALSSNDTGNQSDLQAESGVTLFLPVDSCLSTEPVRALDSAPDRMDHASKFN